jgi:hypothetical protein
MGDKDIMLNLGRCDVGRLEHGLQGQLLDESFLSSGPRKIGKLLIGNLKRDHVLSSVSLIPALQSCLIKPTNIF